jgi:hypothetical protein
MMPTRCPHCGKSVHGHDQGKTPFRKLSRAQQRSAIGVATKNLKKMKDIYKAETPARA